MAEHGLGGLPSPTDPSDWQEQADTGLILPSRFLLTGIPAAYNQHDTPMCGGFSGAGIKSVHERADGHGNLIFDAPGLYHLAQQYDGIAGAHAGTTARGVCKALQKVGARVAKPGNERHKILSYSQVPYTFDGYKTAIYSNKAPVLIGARWFDSWFDPVRGVNPKPNYVVGGHLFFGWGWDDSIGPRGSMLCQNSWGQYQGSVNGRFYAPVEGLLPNIHDMWILKDVKGD